MERQADQALARSHSVGTVARLAGVTIRTLHHYGEIGLLTPSGRTSAGYRQYSDADLDRLSRILFYRELGFSLDDIATMLDDPAIDRSEHLRRQHRLLNERLARLQAMVTAVEREMHAMKSGINLTSEEKLEIFGASYNPEWEDESEARWGGTEAWDQSRPRTASYRKDDWKRFRAEGDEMHRHLTAGYQSALAPDSEEAMDLAEAHRQWVSQSWDCTPAMHRNLVDMYIADERFMKTYEEMATGLTHWLRDAVHANADRIDNGE